MGYTNSPLVDCTVYSPNHSGKRTHAIDRITPHCVVGQLSAERIGHCFPAGRGASCNYGIGHDGDVCLIVDEANRSWCSSSNENDQRAITIECASDNKHPYAFTSACYNKLIDLCEDICIRNGKNKLIWFGDKNKSLNYQPKSNEMILTVHRWFANKSCPGDWMYARMGDLADKVTARLSGGEKPAADTLYRVQVGAFNVKANAEKMLNRLKDAGYDGFIVEVNMESGSHKPTEPEKPQLKSATEIAKEIWAGKCSDSRWDSWGGGSTRKERLEAAGYNYDEVQHEIERLYK